MNQSSDNNYFHIPLPGDEPQIKAGFYSSAPVATPREVIPNAWAPQQQVPMMHTNETVAVQPIQANAGYVSRTSAPTKKNALLAYLVLLVPLLGPALSFLILGRKIRGFVTGGVFLLYFILSSVPDEFMTFKGILGLYITVEFFILLFKIPKLSRTDPIPGKYWS